MNQSQETGEKVRVGRFCAQCGQEVVEGGSFCVGCGAAVVNRGTQELKEMPAIPQPANVLAAARPKPAGRSFKAFYLAGAIALGAAGIAVGGYHGYQYFHQQAVMKAKAAQIVANRGRIDNSWAVAVAAHEGFLKQLGGAGKADLTPFVTSAGRIKSQLEGQIQSLQGAVPDYMENPPLKALVAGLQNQADFYGKMPSALKQRSWDLATAAWMTGKLKESQNQLKKVAELVPGLAPAVGSAFTDMAPLQQQVEFQQKQREAKERYASEFASVLGRYNNTRDDMQRFADRIRSGYVTRIEALSEFRAAQEKRMAIRNELTRLAPPSMFRSVHGQLDGVLRDSLVALDGAIQAIAAIGSDFDFDVAFYWDQFQRGSQSISRRMGGLEATFNRLRASI